MATKHSPANTAPQKTCRECGRKSHVRNKKCPHCGEAFSPMLDKPLSVDETIDSVIKALELVNKLGESEAIKLIKKVANQ